MRSQPIDVRERPRYSTDQFRIQDEFQSDISSVLISEGEIDSRIEGMAQVISREYRSRCDLDLYALCVLKGAMRFFGALIPRLKLDGPFNEGVLQTKRYSDGKSGTQKADITWFEPETIKNRDILIVEDIIDEGYTMDTILSEIQEHNPNSVEVAVLFDKIQRRKTEIDIDYTGFVIPNDFVVGYGLDYDERYRNLGHLAVVDQSS